MFVVEAIPRLCILLMHPKQRFTFVAVTSAQYSQAALLAVQLLSREEVVLLLYSGGQLWDNQNANV